jgi:hypothetical protein
VYLKTIKRRGVTIFGVWVTESGFTKLMQIAVTNRWRKICNLCVVDVVLSSTVAVLQVVIVMVRQSVWANTQSGWVDPRSVVRTGWWDHGENQLALVAIHWC